MLSGVDSFTFGGENDGVEFQACSEKGRDAMVRLARAEVFDSADITIAHVYNRTVRRGFLMGDDTVTGNLFMVYSKCKQSHAYLSATLRLTSRGVNSDSKSDATASEIIRHLTAIFSAGVK